MQHAAAATSECPQFSDPWADVPLDTHCPQLDDLTWTCARNRILLDIALPRLEVKNRKPSFLSGRRFQTTAELEPTEVLAASSLRMFSLIPQQWRNMAGINDSATPLDSCVIRWFEVVDCCKDEPERQRCGFDSPVFGESTEEMVRSCWLASLTQLMAGRFDLETFSERFMSGHFKYRRPRGRHRDDVLLFLIELPSPIDLVIRHNEVFTTPQV
jgi:hypothetical protein